MADLRCSICGEPWDMDCLHDEAAHRYTVPYYCSEEDRQARRRNPGWDPDAYNAAYREVRAEFVRRGCVALAGAYGTGPCKPRDTRATQTAGALYDLLGDDLDGVAAMLEDAGL